MAAIDPVLSEAMKLDDADRVELAHRLLDSVEAPDPHLGLSDSQFVELLDQRARELADGAVRGIPLDEVLARLKPNK